MELEDLLIIIGDLEVARRDLSKQLMAAQKELEELKGTQENGRIEDTSVIQPVLPAQ